MITWCASECGNLSCGFNAAHCKEPDKNRNYVFMKNNLAMHCMGWKKPQTKAKQGKRKKGMKQ